jgi:hypothetical protein
MCVLRKFEGDGGAEGKCVWGLGRCCEENRDNKTAYFVASSRFFTFHYVYDARSHEHQICLKNFSF